MEIRTFATALVLIVALNSAAPAGKAGKTITVEGLNQIGDAARLKKLFRVAKADLKPAPLGGDLPAVTKEEVHDFLPDLKATGGYVVDKIEGFTVASDSTAYAVTDNDGVDDSSGETLFFSIGKL